MWHIAESDFCQCDGVYLCYDAYRTIRHHDACVNQCNESLWRVCKRLSITDKRRVDFIKTHQELWLVHLSLFSPDVGGVIIAVQLKADGVSSPVNAPLNTHFHVIMTVPMSEEIPYGYCNYHQSPCGSLFLVKELNVPKVLRNTSESNTLFLTRSYFAMKPNRS